MQIQQHKQVLFKLLYYFKGEKQFLCVQKGTEANNTKPKKQTDTMGTSTLRNKYMHNLVNKN